LIDKIVTVELKNDLQIKGKLLSVDQYLNMKIGDVEVLEKEKFPQLLALKTIFIRGSVIRYVHVPPEHIDVELLQDASRKEAIDAQKALSKR
jgi:small nuclear ribonucleoprotein (snRNP)-like protein